MNLFFSYVSLNNKQIFRNYSAIFFTLFLPVVLILLFGHQAGVSQIDRVGSLVVFSNYAVQTSMFLNLGMRISEQRNSDWSIYLKTLPARPVMQFMGLVVSQLLVAAVALALVLIGGLYFLHIHIGAYFVTLIIISALLGGIPMGLLGLAFGYRINPGAARGVMVFVNLLLLFASFSLPEGGLLGHIREFIPTYQWVLISLSHIIPEVNRITPWLWMLGYTVVFYVLAHWSYAAKKDLRSK